jgi:diguanylate cyclase (GGDEF)-like protein/PAS domain S-box-containing protein
MVEPAGQGILKVSRMPPVKRLVRVMLGLAFLALVASLLAAESNRHGGVSVIWLSNGLLIGVLLCSDRRQWPAFIALGYAVDLSINLLMRTGLMYGAFLSIFNMVEVLLAAALMFRSIKVSPDFTEVRQFRSLLLYGVLLAPFAASFLASLYQRLVWGTPFSQTWQFWFAADVLGVATVTPLYLSYHYRRRFTTRSMAEAAILYSALALVTLVVFGLVTVPMLWVVLLFLVLLGMRLGFTGAALGLLMVSLIGGFFTVMGNGPLADSTSTSLNGKILLFQCFVATSMLALYVTEVGRARSNRMRLELVASETRFRLLTEASRDAIVLADLEGRRQYVSPAMTELLGWTEEELKAQDSSEIVHPNDLPRLCRLFADCRIGEENLSSVSYQSRKKDGSYLWVEVNVRLFRDQESSAPTGFVYVLRDISERKAAEDGLTGVANRRLLDETLQQEWLRGIRDHTPLSVLLIDVDFFKRYNDLYGHLAGDACLQQIAKAIQQVLKRPQDLLARYGGEEFVVVLPNTPARGAELIAERSRSMVEQRAIVHDGSSHTVATVSVGCATMIPTVRSEISALMRLADSALYQAKSGGRNRLQVSEEASPVTGVQAEFRRVPQG